jgi:GT2 family glycosyltransferase
VSPGRVRACIVAYLSGDRAVAACRSAGDCGAEVVLVNNSGGDGAGAAVREACPGAEVRTPETNLGFAAGCNLAAEGAESEFLLFLNPDAILGPGALDLLVEHLDRNPTAAIAGPALTFPDGRPQASVRLDPTAGAVLHQYTAWGYTKIFGKGYREYRAPDPGPGGPVPVLMGSVLLVRTALFRDLAGFDERFFMYFEEADLCRRARDLGSTVDFVPGATASHVGGASAARGPGKLAAERLVSAQRYVRKFSGGWRRTLFKVAFLIGFPPRALLDLLRDLFYFVVYRLMPGRREKARRKAREALSALRLLTVDLFRVIFA